MRSAPQSRLSFAISLIMAIVSAATFGWCEEAFDLRFQTRRKSSRCHREPRLWLNNEEGLFPCPNHSCQEHEEQAIRFRACRPFHLPFEDDELLSQEGIFRHKLGLASAKVGEGLKRQGRSQWCGPLKNACSQYHDTRTHEPLETRKNHHELLLQEDRLLILWQCEHLFSPTHVT
jgi:hypothetical protein